ncbi:MAG: tRNA (adenosine(37)-N6)-threonylcarbamoyltransferase complex dimerization subunit type 1 TsaB [Planctomycetota bacterium]
MVCQSLAVVAARRASMLGGMKLVAIETAHPPGSLATLDTHAGAAPAVTPLMLPEGERTARSLAPALHKLLQQSGWRLEQLDAVAVTVGPGSFTGLRLGVTSAKALAYAAAAVCVPVNTLAVLAAQAGGAAGWAVLDAHRGELFAAPFAGPGLTGEVEILAEAAWLGRLAEGDTVTGPVLGRLRDRLPPGVTSADPADWLPKAETVAKLATAAVEAGDTVSPFELLPDYYRPSAAEEKLLGGDAAS